MRSSDRWEWAACGKHPVSRDFFSLGSDGPTAKAFFAWIRAGYSMLSPRREGSFSHRSWRFWSFGPRKDSLVCGLVRDSADGIGRPYPLALVGNGSLKGCEDHWHLVAFACDKTWIRMELLASRMFGNLKDFENSLVLIPPPEDDWRRIEVEKESRRHSMAGGAAGLAPDQLSWDAAPQDENSPYCVIPLGNVPAGDQPGWIDVYLHAVRARLKLFPHAVFMGGTSSAAFLVLYRKPLAPQDFVRLWS